MKNEKFDRLLSTIRNENVDENAVAQAGNRVWKSIAESSPVTEPDRHVLRSCEDFQALIPAYLAKELQPARAMLFEDHVHPCVACRHAIERAKDGERQQVWRVRTNRPSALPWRWAMGAAAVAAVLVVAFAFSNGFLPGQHPVRKRIHCCGPPARWISR